jgi:uncharacterized protein
MMCRRSVVKTLAILLGAACLASPALAGVNAITWRDLRPAAQPGSLSQLLADTKSASETEVLAWRDDQEVVQLTGFLLPVEQDGDFVTEFMLVPWAGACSHMPAPPPNQLVHVFPATPFRLDRIYQPVTVTAALRPDMDVAQFYMIDGPKVLDYGYSMRRADVAPATKITDPDARALPPGSFLSKR